MWYLSRERKNTISTLIEVRKETITPLACITSLQCFLALFNLSPGAMLLYILHLFYKLGIFDGSSNMLDVPRSWYFVDYFNFFLLIHWSSCVEAGCIISVQGRWGNAASGTCSGEAFSSLLRNINSRCSTNLSRPLACLQEIWRTIFPLVYLANYQRSSSCSLMFSYL